MNFGLYLLALVGPPLYFLTRKRIGAAALHCCLFLVSVILFITIIGTPVAIILWLGCIVHALWHVRRQLVTEHAEILATKMVQKMTARPLPVSTIDGLPPVQR